MNNTENSNDNKNNCCDLECCICKKIFMALVILILTFMSGIMVGNSGRCHYSDQYYHSKPSNRTNNMPKKFHKGMHQIPNTQPQNSSPTQSPGGFIIEIDETN